jgi:hypothetical protein
MNSLNTALFSTILISSITYAADSPIELPSSVPVDVFKINKNQRGIGYIGFNVTLELEDEDFNDKIGDIDYESKGIIYSMPGDGGVNFLGNMFELSYTAGAIEGLISTAVFTDNGKNYNNTYDKDGFYFGYRPSYSKDLHTGDSFQLKASTTLHSFFYSVSGEFSVNDGSFEYRFEEDNYGLALKPTTVIQGTYRPSNSLGLTMYGGLSTFLAIDWVFYDGGDITGTPFEDNEVELLSSGINVVFGYDISYKFDNGSVFNIASILSQREEDNSIETVIRYMYFL